MVETLSSKEGSSSAAGNLKAVFPGKYIQGEGALGELPDLIGLLGRRGLILASPSAKREYLSGYASQGLPLEEFRGECCEGEIRRLTEIVRREGADVLVGMGGGKAVDTAKIAADRAGIPVLIVPTIASTDAPCSGCAVVYTEEGVFESVSYQRMNPSVV